MPEAARTIAVIDGNSLMHRAFHAIRQPMTAPDGRSTGALFGFFNMFIKMVDTFHPDGVICAFDKGKPRVRMEMLPQYKAQRPPMDPSLHEQFPMVKELLRTLDVPVAELEGWEGDDILGTLARRGEAAGYDMLLFTGDRDMYQLSTEHVKIVSTQKGVSEVKIMNPESVEDLYHGITPELVPDFYGLKGDSSDNIPGVPGIGPKKAAALIVRYGSLDEVIAHADEVPGKMGESLRAHVDDALVSRRVATIRTDAPIDLDLSDARFPTFDPAEVARAFSALGFTGMTTRLVRLAGEGAVAAARAALDDGEGATEPTALPDPLSGDDARAALDGALAGGAWVGCALDDDRAADALFGTAHTLWAATGEAICRFDDAEADDALERILREGRLAAGNVKALLHALSPVDSSEPERLAPREVDPARIFDVAVAAYLLDSERASFSPAELAEAYLSRMLPAATDALPEAALDAVRCLDLVRPLRERLEQDGSERLFDDMEMPLLPVLAEMERAGLAVDTRVLAAQSAELGSEVSGMIEKIHAAAGEPFNIDSPMQLSHVLFDVLGLPTFGLKRTKRGYYSTNAKVLADLAAEHEIVADVLEYRERSKIKSTYLDALPALVRGDRRVHTTLNQTVTATGRLSSSDPNLQNIPTRSELGHRVRQAFTVPEGSVFLACDYSQIELRLLAHLSGDEHLIAAFCEGRDFHAATAARVFGVSLDEVTPQLRSRAKAVNFGIVYGQQAFGLASSLKIPRAEAQEMIDRYFAAYPGVRAFLDEAVRVAHERGYAETMYGRKRHIREFQQRNRQLVAFGERTAMNHPMQGSAADIIKIAMRQVQSRLMEEGMASRLLVQVHDELDFSAPEGEVEALSAMVREVMENAAQLRVPLVVDVQAGANWAEAH